MEIVLTDLTKEIVLVTCKEANIKQEFPIEDIPGLLKDMPHLIKAEKGYVEKKKTVRFRVFCFNCKGHKDVNVPLKNDIKSWINNNIICECGQSNFGVMGRASSYQEIEKDIKIVSMSDHTKAIREMTDKYQKDYKYTMIISIEGKDFVAYSNSKFTQSEALDVFNT